MAGVPLWLNTNTRRPTARYNGTTASCTSHHAGKPHAMLQHHPCHLRKFAFPDFPTAELSSFPPFKTSLVTGPHLEHITLLSRCQ